MGEGTLLQNVLALMRRHATTNNGAALYFHYPCFDGIVSGALTLDFLERQEGWKVVHLCPVNYEARDTWLGTNLRVPSAIVDFLYHPQAQFWADHHLTTFVDESARLDFHRRKDKVRLYYSDRCRSCASLLWNNLSEVLSDRERYKEMVDWADKIDSASYSSVEEAVFGDAPALRISFSLMHNSGEKYGKYLLKQLRHKTLEQVAQLPEIMERYQRVRAMMQGGLDRLKDHIVLLEDQIAAFDVESAGDVIVSRYLPYYFFPEARYSIGIFRLPNAARITAMRNPWLDFESVSLGNIFERYGGGGHQRVASVFLPDARAKDAEDIADKLLRAIREAESIATPTVTEGVLA
jgi:hypothetical protein